MSTQRTMPGGFVHRSALPKGENGRSLCRWCALEVPPRRFTFCSEYCVHEWRLRTNPGYLREQVFLRDKGVCVLCRLDTVKAFAALKRSRGASRRALFVHWGLKGMSRRTLWDADHIVPVAEGGGECDLDNIRTLCLRCHRLSTLELRARLMLRRSTSEPGPGTTADF